MNCDLSGCACEDLSGCPCVDMSGCAATLTQEPNPAQESVEATWGLRLRRQVSQLENDLSNNLIVLHPAIRPPSFEEIARYNPPRLNEIYLQSILGLIQFLRASASFLQLVWQVLANAGNGIRRSFKDDIYVFFRGSSYPYLLDTLELQKPGMPEIDWYYNAKTHTFVTARLYNNSSQYHTHHLPYLSAEVKYNDLVLYDVTDFVNGARWAGEEGEAMPDVNHIISAWTLTTGIVLKRSDGMRLSFVNTDGNDAALPLRNDT